MRRAIWRIMCEGLIHIELVLSRSGPMTVEVLTDAALALPPETRAELAETLLHSLDEQRQTDIGNNGKWKLTSELRHMIAVK
jgi:hypothetical protein